MNFSARQRGWQRRIEETNLDTDILCRGFRIKQSTLRKYFTGFHRPSLDIFEGIERRITIKESQLREREFTEQPVAVLLENLVENRDKLDYLISRIAREEYESNKFKETMRFELEEATHLSKKQKEFFNGLFVLEKKEK